jgi:hypothetical protein
MPEPELDLRTALVIAVLLLAGMVLAHERHYRSRRQLILEARGSDGGNLNRRLTVVEEILMEQRDN